MRGWLVLIIVVVLVAAGLAIYSNTHQQIVQRPSTTSIPEIIPGVSSVEYRDTEFGYSIQYPEIATSSDVDFGGYLPLTQTPIASFVLPRSMSQGTNLAEAGVYIGATSTPKVVASCGTSSPEVGETAEGTTTINDAAFSIFKSSGAGAGNFYDTTTYRTVHNGTCFELVELLHSGNIANYPDGTVVEFDKLKFQGYLEAIVKTFSFIE